MAKQTHKTNIIILNWNGAPDTIECLDSLKNLHTDHYNIILIDNGSEDHSIDQLEQYTQTQPEPFRSRIHLIKSPHNLGFAKGCNHGIHYCQTHHLGTQVLLLNNDTTVEPDFLTLITEFHNTHPQYIAIAPQIRLYHTPDKIWNCGGTIKNGYRKYYYQNAPVHSLPHKEYLETTYLTGCALYFDAQQTGPLTERFFHGEEDFEFALRLHAQGQKMACLLTSIIYHKWGNSIKKQGTNNTIAAQCHIHYLNRLIDCRDYIKPHYRYLILLHRSMLDLYFYLRKTTHYTHRQRINIIHNIIADTHKYDHVDHDLFQSIFKQYQQQ